MNNRRYVIITPCRDEAEFLPVTIHSVVAQSVPPTKWVIVDDGSTDRSPDILARVEREYPFIQVVRREDRGERELGSGVIDAFYAGLRQIDLNDYDYLCKLDGDLELPDRYFERIIERFESDPSLGNASGRTHVRLASGKLVSERLGGENAIGAAKFYRVECFRDIGCFVQAVSWDAIDGHMCRMKGWVALSADDPELRIVHLRRMGTSHKGLWTGRLRWGRGKWYMGSAWYYILAAAVYRMFERPFVVGGLGILCGYLSAMLRRAPRHPDREYRRFLRRYELRSLLFGKRRTMRRYHSRIRSSSRHTRDVAPTAHRQLDAHAAPGAANRAYHLLADGGGSVSGET